VQFNDAGAIHNASSGELTLLVPWLGPDPDSPP